MRQHNKAIANIEMFIGHCGLGALHELPSFIYLFIYSEYTNVSDDAILNVSVVHFDEL